MTFVPQDTFLYRITSGLDQDMVLDISQNHEQLNTAIVYKWNNGANQKFAFRSVGSGKFAIFSAKNNMTLQVAQCSYNNGVQIVAGQPSKH